MDKNSKAFGYDNLKIILNNSSMHSTGGLKLLFKKIKIKLLIHHILCKSLNRDAFLTIEKIFMENYWKKRIKINQNEFFLKYNKSFEKNQRSCNSKNA